MDEIKQSLNNDGNEYVAMRSGKYWSYGAEGKEYICINKKGLSIKDGIGIILDDGKMYTTVGSKEFIGRKFEWFDEEAKADLIDNGVSVMTGGKVVKNGWKGKVVGEGMLGGVTEGVVIRITDKNQYVYIMVESDGVEAVSDGMYRVKDASEIISYPPGDENTISSNTIGEIFSNFHFFRDFDMNEKSTLSYWKKIGLVPWDGMLVLKIDQLYFYDRTYYLMLYVMPVTDKMKRLRKMLGKNWMRIKKY